MAVSSFKRQLKFTFALVDAYARLTAEALLNDNVDCAKSLARSFELACRFRDSRIWSDWTCSTYEVFSKKFSECCEKGEV